MKQFLYTLVFLVSAFGFAQNSGVINGHILDLEEANAPLLYAKVSIKETGAEALSNETGLFTFENLKEGTYTLVYSFVGYETKETKVNVAASNNEDLKLYLGASTVSLNDLAALFASADVEEPSIATTNK
ncbi:carboxypeptidase-like regulatory domain-containing protein [Tamlana sp. I1]|uniref:carboxypeptidase-like regulatory domain-containing protein n=1 Tax=Tamlana sp. I1 TaxID=2762061 RepID=UPI00188EE810|nr:carboxypeptidase-like regulatory domain-containing protein [Tamlana sp. I1]